jgi:hypothetical protein
LGHERVGRLPKTERWQVIVNSISSFNPKNDTTAEIASQTTKNVRQRFQFIENDTGVFAAFKYILALTHSTTQTKPHNVLAEHGIELSKNFSLYDLASSIQSYVEHRAGSKEYAQFASQSMIETISEWARSNQTIQTSLFESNTDSLGIWQKAANGAGFCEVSRLFFSKFTERYLKYFLEREVARNMGSVLDRNEFSKNLEKHIERISKHAFETSKITQSFAAGWYNKEVTQGFPTESKIRGFLSFAFKKLNSELIREELKHE